MKYKSYLLPLFIAPVLLLASAAAGSETITLAEMTPKGIAIVQINCVASEATASCLLSGTRISKYKQKPMGAIMPPDETCYIESGTSRTVLRNMDGVYVAEEGPAGSMCVDFH